MIPVIDLSDPLEQCVKELVAACADWGFFHVINHGIDAALITSLQSASREFFELPLSIKHAASRTLDNPFGYYDREITKNLRDRKEIFDYAPYESTPWPSSPTGFQAILEEYGMACHQLALQLIAICCEGLHADRLALEHHFQHDHSSFLRLNCYPLTDPLTATDTPPTGSLGISQHTDSGAMTVLLQDEIAGLQVLSRDRWVDVCPMNEALTINIGDMLQVWSNDQYRAPLHRVRASQTVARYSAAYFCNPSYETIVEPLPSTLASDKIPRYRPVSWAEFRRLRALGDYGDYGEEVQLSDFQL